LADKRKLFLLLIPQRRGFAGTLLLVPTRTLPGERQEFF
jgi:hypothetical protein